MGSNSSETCSIGCFTKRYYLINYIYKSSCLTIFKIVNNRNRVWCSKTFTKQIDNSVQRNLEKAIE